jgi:hypothetical protein
MEFMIYQSSCNVGCFFVVLLLSHTYAKQLLGIETSLSLETADLNHDGKINAIDAVIILKQYAQSLISK